MASSEQSQAPKERNSESNYTNLYIKYFPQDMTEEDVSDLFGGYGPMQAVKVMTDPRGRKSAFVNFEQHADACNCVAEMHRRDLRPRAERKAAEKAEKEGKPQPVITDSDGHPEHLLFVGRAQSKAERQALMEKRYGGKGGGLFTPSLATGGGKGGSGKEGKGESNGWSQQSHSNVTRQAAVPTPSTVTRQAAVPPPSVLSLAPPVQNYYSTNHATRSPASCSFQQNLQNQQWNQQQWSYNSPSGYYGASDDAYGCSGSGQYDGSYDGSMTNSYGTYGEDEGDGNWSSNYGSSNYGWGVLDGNGVPYAQQSF